MMTKVAEIQKNSRETYRVTKEIYQGVDLLNVRVWFKAEDGEMRPTRKGIAVKLEQWPELLKAIEGVL